MGFTNFSRAQFKEADFSEVKFTKEVEADFSHAQFTESAVFFSARFTERVDFSGAYVKMPI